MKTILKITLLSILLFALGCSKDDNEVQPPVAVKSDAKALTSLVFNAADNAVLAENVSATVSEASKSIAVSLPIGTDVSALTPTIQVSAKASVSPTGAQDFSSPVTYTVTAEDGSTAKYTASVIVLEIENSAPLIFELVAVTDNAVEVDVLPTFNWNAATDPDGETVTYDLYLDTGATADQLYAENLSVTSFEVTERLTLLQDYVWRVVAKDPVGATVSSTTRSFSTRAVRFNDTPVTANAEFGFRYDHDSAIFNNKLWIIGGQTSNGRNNDVWSSEDGVNWTEAISTAPFSGRRGHTLVVFDNKLWVIGGLDVSDFKNDIWFSEDGVTWSEAITSAPFTGRSAHTSIVFDSKLWVIGGFGENGDRKNDIWFSEDGVSWSEAINSAPFTERAGHTSVVYDNKIWVIGGLDIIDFKNDVWFSEDGITWTEATGTALFSERAGHTSVVFDNKVWVIAGNFEDNQRLNDVWFSEDGSIWHEATNSAPFTGRVGHTSEVFENKVWVITGLNDDGSKDVWTFE